MATGMKLAACKDEAKSSGSAFARQGGDLTIETLEEQTEETQRRVNKL